MRACILGNTNIKHMTLMSLYTTYFDKKGITYDIIYIDDYGIIEECGASQYYRFINKSSDEASLQAKIGRYLSRIKYKKFVRSILKKEKYDLIVVWREETAILFSKLLTNNYKGKYTVNIRDIDICEDKRQEKNLYKLEKCVKSALFSTVSSDGFIQRLPDGDYLFVHSANKSLLGDVRIRSEKKLDSPIIISNVGTFRNDDYCFRMADAFANDSRFELRFIGQGSERMQEYVQDHGYLNIKCQGSFEPKETVNLLEDADVINCAYGADRLADKAKMPIRFYYGVYLAKPILATEDTWIEKVAAELQFGISIPANFKNSTFSIESVYKKYMQIDWDVMRSNLEDYKNKIEISHKNLQEKLDEYFYSE